MSRPPSTKSKSSRSFSPASTRNGFAEGRTTFHRWAADRDRQRAWQHRRPGRAARADPTPCRHNPSQCVVNAWNRISTCSTSRSPTRTCPGSPPWTPEPPSSLTTAIPPWSARSTAARGSDPPDAHTARAKVVRSTTGRSSSVAVQRGFMPVLGVPEHRSEPAFRGNSASRPSPTLGGRSIGAPPVVTNVGSCLFVIARQDPSRRGRRTMETARTRATRFPARRTGGSGSSTEDGNPPDPHRGLPPPAAAR